MARALENLERDPTYLDFFGMTRPPFARLTAPDEIFYSDQCALLTGHLANATEKSDSLIVICGADGSGKTTLLNQYIANLSEEVSYAAFDDTCKDGTQFYCAFLRQLGFSEITGTLRELRRITREFLIHRGIAGDPVLVFMDNAHLVSPSVLEQLRWISETRVTDRRVLSVVVAGNSDLPRIMDSPAMKLLKFQSNVNFSVRVFSEAETEDYVRHRMRLAGGADAAKFSAESLAVIYRFTGGIPRLINKLCNAVLTESLAQETRVISGQLIRKVAEQLQILPHVVPLKGKGRRRTDPVVSLSEPEQQSEERITARDASSKPAGNDRTQGPLIPDADVKELLLQVAKLSEQLDESTAATSEALRDIDARDKVLSELRQQLAQQAKKSIDLAKVIALNESEIERLTQALWDTSKQRKTSEKDAKKLASKLSKQQKLLADKARESDILETTVEKNVEEIDRLNRALAESGKALTDSEELARKLAADVEKFENSGTDELISDLRKQIETQAKESEKLAATVESEAEEIDRLNQALAESEKALTDNEELASKLAADVERFENSGTDEVINDLRKQIETQAKESEKLAATVESDAEEIDRLNQTLAESEKALADSEELASKLAADVEKFENSGTDEVISDLRKQIETQAKESEKLAATVESEAEEIDRLNQALAESEKALADSEGFASKLAADVEKFENSGADELINDLRKQIESQAKESEKLATTVETDAEEIDRLNQSLAESKKALADSEELAGILAADVEKFENSGTDELISDLRKQIESQARESEKLGTAVESDAEEIDRLNQALAESKKALADSEELAGILAADVEKFENSGTDELISDLRQQIETQAKESEKLATTVESDAEEIDRLNQALAERKKALADGNKASKKLAAKLKKEKSASKHAKTDVDQAKARIEKLDQMRSELQASVSNLTAELTLANKQVAKLDKLEKSLDESQKEYASLESDLDDLKSVQELVSERNVRIAELEAVLATYTTDSTTTQAKLPQMKAKSHSKKSKQTATRPGGTIAAIEVFHGGKRQQAFELPDGDARIMIGRGDDSDLRLDTQYVSRHHALVFCSGTRIYIEDLHSFNGTLVNSKTISRCELHPNDTVNIGDFKLQARKA